MYFGVLGPDRVLSNNVNVIIQLLSPSNRTSDNLNNALILSNSSRTTNLKAVG
jgi:hypothetical protein